MGHLACMQALPPFTYWLVICELNFPFQFVLFLNNIICGVSFLKADWLTADWLTGWLTDWLTADWQLNDLDWVTYWVANWLTDWLIIQCCDSAKCLSSTVLCITREICFRLCSTYLFQRSPPVLKERASTAWEKSNINNNLRKVQLGNRGGGNTHFGASLRTMLQVFW